MKLIEEVVLKIRNGQYEFSKHALDQSIRRNIRVSEVRQFFNLSVELVEDYPEDKYGPSCLLLGYTNTNRPLHIQCSYPSRPLVKIITLYQPNPKLWIDNKIRKK